MSELPLWATGAQVWWVPQTHHMGVGQNSPSARDREPGAICPQTLSSLIGWGWSLRVSIPSTCEHSALGLNPGFYSTGKMFAIEKRENMGVGGGKPSVFWELPSTAAGELREGTEQCGWISKSTLVCCPLRPVTPDTDWSRLGHMSISWVQWGSMLTSWRERNFHPQRRGCNYSYQYKCRRDVDISIIIIKYIHFQILILL